MDAISENGTNFKIIHPLGAIRQLDIVFAVPK